MENKMKENYVEISLYEFKKLFEVLDKIMRKKTNDG